MFKVAFILLLSSDKRDFSGTNYTKGNNKGSETKSNSCPILRFDPQLDLPTEREERLISDQVISGLVTRNLHYGESFTSSVSFKVSHTKLVGSVYSSGVPLICFTFF